MELSGANVSEVKWVEEENNILALVVVKADLLEFSIGQDSSHSVELRSSLSGEKGALGSSMVVVSVVMMVGLLCLHFFKDMFSEYSIETIPYTLSLSSFRLSHVYIICRLFSYLVDYKILILRKNKRAYLIYAFSNTTKNFQFVNHRLKLIEYYFFL